MQLFTISADASRHRQGKVCLKIQQRTLKDAVFQMCTIDGMVCMREMPGPTCGVACQGIYADVTKRQLKNYYM